MMGMNFLFNTSLMGWSFDTNITSRVWLFQCTYLPFQVVFLLLGNCEVAFFLSLSFGDFDDMTFEC